MPIKFKCPECGEVISVSSKLAGKSGKCKCGKTVKIPSPKQSASSSKKSRPAAGAGKPSKSAKAASVSAAMFDELTDQDYGRTNPYEQLYEKSGDNNDAEQLSRFTHEEAEKKKKEAGTARTVLKIVSVLNVVGCVFSIVMVVFFATNNSVLEKMGAFFPMARLGQALGITFFAILALLALVGAIGLFMSKAWGWVATGICSDFIVIERLGAIGVTIKEGFDQAGFFAAGAPLMAALFLTMFIFKEDARVSVGAKGVLPMVLAIVLGFGLGIGAVVAVFDAIKKPPPRVVMIDVLHADATNRWSVAVSPTRS
ncbi:MAG: hypothetical protein ACE361_20800 [Aureliella sp.]